MNTPPLSGHHVSIRLTPPSAKIIQISLLCTLWNRPGRYIVLTIIATIVKTSKIIILIVGFEKTSEIVCFDCWL